jgi:hypothetical protein
MLLNCFQQLNRIVFYLVNKVSFVFIPLVHCSQRNAYTLFMLSSNASPSFSGTCLLPLLLEGCRASLCSGSWLILTCTMGRCFFISYGFKSSNAFGTSLPYANVFCIWLINYAIIVSKSEACFADPR